jgi:uncharacterized protein DUF3592
MQSGKILFKLLGLIAGLTLFVYGLQDRREQNRIRANGQVAVVEPITGYKEFKSKGSSTYTAEFKFKTSDGRDITQKHSFPEELIEDFKAGKPVQVVYMTQDPNTFIFEKDRPSWTLVVIGVLLALAALILA